MTISADLVECQALRRTKYVRCKTHLVMSCTMVGKYPSQFGTFLLLKIETKHTVRRKKNGVKVNQLHDTRF